MSTRKLTSTDAFVVVDLPDAPVAAGVARLAPKVLVDGATWLARSQTYQFAAFGRRASGASAGINASAEGRAEAVSAFVAEMVAGAGDAGAPVLLEAGRGLSTAELEGVRASDPRPQQWWDEHHALRGVGVAAAAALATGGSLEGRTVAVEGFDTSGPSLVAALTARGARVVALATAAGCAADPSGLDVAGVAEAWSAHGAQLVEHLGGSVATAGSVLSAAADVLVVGSKAGVVDHDVAAEVRATVVVPSGPIPVTAKAAAALARRGVVVLPDFVTTGGHLVAWPEADAALPGDLPAAAAALVEGALAEVLGHPAGPLLGACEQAEAFLASWRDELPFGRPLA